MPDYTVPSHLSIIKETLDLAQNIEEKIKTKNISLKEDAEGALEPEKSVSESYLNDVMSKGTDSETISKLQRLLKDTDSHVKDCASLLLKESLSRLNNFRKSCAEVVSSI